MEAFHASISMHIPYAAFTASNNNNNNNNNSFIMQQSGNNMMMNTAGPWMDSRIWSRLPQRLMDRVIAFLPPPAFFRARAVCKRWYGLLFSNTFLEFYLQVSPRRHWFIFFNQKSVKSMNNIYRTTTTTTTTSINGGSNCEAAGYIFDPNTITWYRVTFPLIPPGFSPASSSGGLICWVSDEAGSKSILVCNPLLVGSLTPLPSTLRPRLFPSVGLNITNSSIDLVVAGDDLISPYAVKNLTTESFHIDGGGFYSIWGTTSTLPRLCSLESGRMVHVEGRFYCMNYSPFSVLGYDIVGNNWFKIQAPMRRFLRSPSLVEGRGKLILVAAVEKSKLNVPKSLRLWTLQECGSMWVEIERMPQQLYVEFEEIEGGNGFDCVGHGETIMIMIRGTDKALMFDFWRKSWMWVPCCPFVHNTHGQQQELHGFAYEPRLATPVTTLLDQLNINSFQSFT